MTGTFSYTFRWAIFCAALLLTGCATLPPPPIAPAPGSQAGAVSPDQLMDVEWRLVEMRQADGAPLTPGDDADYTVRFDVNGRFGGQLLCNRMSGNYEVEGGALVFGPIATTMAFCPDDGLLSVYTAALGSAVSYRMESGPAGDERLVVGYGDGGGALVYAPATLSATDAPTLEGVLWRLQAMQLADGELLAPGPEEVENVRFAEDRVEGRADCNQFSGPYSVDNGLLSIGPLRSTRVACPADSLSSRFLSALQNATAYGYDDEGNLRIAFGPGANSLTLRAGNEGE